MTNEALVKICGVTDIMTAHIVEQAGADLIGFVFAKSKRQVTPKVAKTISQSLETSIKTVGVFVDCPKDTVEQIARDVGLDYVQLHGSETPAEIMDYNVPAIKALKLTTKEDLTQLTAYDKVCAYLLVDGPMPGSGETFDWTWLSEMFFHTPLLLAGGLNVDNLDAAKRLATISGFDVSSGVETEGKKDHQKITAFINKAKGREQYVSTTK
ncbi:phosphoribosylanthranilate isomerase [Halolactibacillus halophilus]|uniref:N-(5'-phosphoribosyl)anthranilate isomerase n=1 Tax=Halolactibacillus halophilus TaxID=306540 RepID=A0A1I5RQX7_9BACI|nr:phosphoribosylanthranilate isomerase [Halolactibacillus halophilus]GEM02370.1 N-(5'-phosphoribosyl)anthranilate isomerase [Halolactibacillus halophilus]SFP60903.1 phosphoribosylanthranilate isomerase [Halolactibacillus halophilus]